MLSSLHTNTRALGALAVAHRIAADGFWAVDVELDSALPASLCALAVAYVEHGRVADARRWTFRPPGIQGRWSTYHGIEAAALRHAPPLARAFPPCLSHLHEAPHLVAYNAGFERRVLAAVAAALELPRPRLGMTCALSLARATLSLARHRLEDVAAHLGVAHRPHDPTSDAIATAHVVLGLARIVQDP